MRQRHRAAGMAGRCGAANAGTPSIQSIAVPGHRRTPFPEPAHVDLPDTRLLLEWTRAPWTFPERVQALDPATRANPVVIDEVQKAPAILDEVHRLIENAGLRFVLCGSSARKLKLVLRHLVDDVDDVPPCARPCRPDGRCPPAGSPVGRSARAPCARRWPPGWGASVRLVRQVRDARRFRTVLRIAPRRRLPYASQLTERCPSGRRSTPGKCVYVDSVPRVRIPPSPPCRACNRLGAKDFLKLWTLVAPATAPVGHGMTRNTPARTAPAIAARTVTRTEPGPNPDRSRRKPGLPRCDPESDGGPAFGQHSSSQSPPGRQASFRSSPAPA